tara:strand:- start:55 stop:435 length:381 start_codon:yes stop_codon:yes gene_type:complete
MKYDITHALQALKPGAEWALRGDDYSGLEWLDKNQTKPTEDEVNAKVTELTNAEPMRLLRIKRTEKLSESDWMANSDVTMSDKWKNYRQQLRDLPQTYVALHPSYLKLDTAGGLDDSLIVWPTPPS